jgi:hypothetical protein
VTVHQDGSHTIVNITGPQLPGSGINNWKTVRSGAAGPYAWTLETGNDGDTSCLRLTITKADGTPGLGVLTPRCDGTFVVPGVSPPIASGPPSYIFDLTPTRADTVRVPRDDGTQFSVPVVDGIFVAVDATSTFRGYTLQAGDRRVGCQSDDSSKNPLRC